MDVKTKILSTVVSQIVADLVNHKDWNSLMEYTDWTTFQAEVNNKELTAKIKLLLQSPEYEQIIKYGNKIFNDEMDRQSEEFNQVLQNFPC
ncbi:hypothetical protein Asch01_00184 [Acinetobacter schindleri]|uniref:hypothetical protein n=1 Tax=Acinetobacter schindleri TaxID=108981 RepID=UPI0030A63CCD